MATTTLVQPVSRHARRRVDVHAIVSELLRHEEEFDELALEERAFCRMIELHGNIGCGLELGMLD